ncbi:hypothetical protein JB92DRAFT_3092597 [Gautieria morchelliformis]|nr:hypothetical protein JB92DRAFT_3092597 [Gautieria morchelliformis]
MAGRPPSVVSRGFVLVFGGLGLVLGMGLGSGWICLSADGAGETHVQTAGLLVHRGTVHAGRERWMSHLRADWYWTITKLAMDALGAGQNLEKESLGAIWSLSTEGVLLKRDVGHWPLALGLARLRLGLGLGHGLLVFKLLLVVDDIIGAVLSPAPVFLMRCRVTFRGSRNAALGFTTRPVLVTATRARAHRAEHNPTVRTVRIRDARSAAGRRGRATSCSGRRGQARGRGWQADEARAGMDIDASSADEEDGERGEGENEKTGEERERERAAIRKKLEVSRARRRSSMSGTFLIVRGS